MSLLLEALKKAEQAKQQAREGIPDEEHPLPTTKEEAPPLPGELPDLEFSLEPATVEASTDPLTEYKAEEVPPPAPALDFPDLAPVEAGPEAPATQEQEEIKDLQRAPHALPLELDESAAPADELDEPHGGREVPPPSSAANTEHEDPPKQEQNKIADLQPAPPPLALELGGVVARLTEAEEETTGVAASVVPPFTDNTNPSPEPVPKPAPAEAVLPHSPLQAPQAEPNSATTSKTRPKAAPEVEQQAAKNLFAAKLVKGTPLPHRRFLLIAGGIAAALATGISYYYWQMLPTPKLVMPAHSPQVHPTPIALPPPTQPVSEAAAAVASKPEPHQENPTLATKAEEHVRDDLLAPPPRRPKEGPPEPLKIVRSAPTDQVNPLLQDAYQNYMAGDAAQAEKAYRQLLRGNPRNRDALLGMATIAAGRQQAGEAVAYYLQMLELDPRDAAAQAGLINFQGQADPVQGESRLKTLLAHATETSFLHFALGNLYAQQSRWGEAQQAYFEAFSADPSNADYAFNLAVSLDHLNQAKPAAKYYEQALSAAAGRPAAFDRRQAQERLQVLSAPR